VLIGAAVTFVVGLAASTAHRKKGSSVKAAVTAAMLLGILLSGNALGQSSSVSLKGTASAVPQASADRKAASAAEVTSHYDFSAVSADINKAITEKKLPGAVLLVGHSGKVVFEQAYGVRKYAGEPGLDGKSSPAEPMTTDTIFDMASLTKCLVTATAIMQLVEQGKVDVDAPVVKYLPEFGVNGKEKVTVRELLTHYSGLPPDVDLKDAWGLAKPDKAEGIRRAMESKLVSVPGTHFEYSDINFITLGAIVEKVSGERLDDYAASSVFAALHMANTRYLPFDRVCGASSRRGSTTLWQAPEPRATHVPSKGGLSGHMSGQVCASRTWIAESTIPRAAPTQHDDQGTKETNPSFDVLLRGTVHDPTTRRMGGVAGHAGLFSTAADVSKYAQALLDKLLYDKGPFPLKQSTLKMMVLPEQPPTAENTATVFTQDGQPTKGVAERGFGWDINSSFSRPRGTVFPVGVSFGHTGFTGTSLWIDPASDTYVVLLANSVHPRGAAPISPLRGQVATDVALALGLKRPTVDDKAVERGEANR
jgi:CubicO group peptidase (beta-lactamase class C family)